MQKGDYIGKVSLVVTDKQHSFFGKLFEMLRTRYFQFVYDGKTGIGKQANKKVNQFPDGMKIP